MATLDQERKSQRIFWILIVTLMLGYGVIKARHIGLAINAYQGQPLDGDTQGAAK